MTGPDLSPDTPRRPALVAGVVYLAAALTLAWPMLTGQFLAGAHSDQYIAGYGFRLFGAEAFRATGNIPLWNPYIFGGLPYVGAMHGDIFYPTAWLRWILPTGTAMNLGFLLHLVVAGAAMYAFLRALRVTFGGALVGGLAYELTGMVASLVSPGHDGKLFVSALTPLLFLGLLTGIRDQRRRGWGTVALVTGLMFHGHPQLAVYALIAGALWGIYLLFGDPERPPVGPPRTHAIAWGLAAVALGVGLYAIQLLPALDYLPFSPRGAGASRGFEYATGFSFPPEEIVSTFLPQFNGVLEHYWGRNGIKFHTEYLGAVVIVLAGVGLASRQDARRKAILLGIAGLFLLVALGGHTPFYGLWYELVPQQKNVRAPGAAFFLVSFVVAVFAGLGAERALAREVTRRRLLAWTVPLALVGLLAALGGLQRLAEGWARPGLETQVALNIDALRAGGLRLFLIVLFGGTTLWAITAGWLRQGIALAALGIVVVGDLWSVDRPFFSFRPPVRETYADDPITAAIRRHDLPFRVWDPAGGLDQYGVYPKSWLMAYRIPTLLGYHGNELNAFDELLGGKNLWRGQAGSNIWSLFAVRFVVLGQAEPIPGYHQVVGPVPVTTGGQGVLFEADSARPWVQVIPAGAKIPEEQIAPTIADPRFPVDRVVLFPDSSGLDLKSLEGKMPEPAPVRATLRHWEPGAMQVALEGRAETPVYLLVAENWYKDWTAMIDGHAAPVYRANHTMLSVVLPPGAQEVSLVFRSPAYQKGRAISLLAALLVLLLLLWPNRKSVHG